MKRFVRKIVMVTGGSSGIGRETLLAFSREGAIVVNADVLEEKGRQIIEQVKAEGGDGSFIATDVSISGQVENLVARVVEKYGRLDIAVNNAGIEEPFPGKMAEITEESWNKVHNTNLKGIFLCMKHEIPQMLRQGGGAIVNTASTCGIVAAPDVASYVASKHGVVGLTRAAAVDYARDNIRINAVCPATSLTDKVIRVTRGDPAELKRL
jgi:NAD(P)-dependent dehydrogenase (short-subunit alcohol dehydrogenase family)